MIADDRGSRIAKSSPIVCDHMETHFYDRLRSCDRDRRLSQKIAEDGTMFYLLRSFAIVCDQLRSCDHMETKVLRSAIQTYPIIFWIPTHDSTLLYSNKARIFACSNRLFVVNMAGVEQGNVSSEEFMEEFARYEYVYHRDSKDFRYKSKTAKKSGRNLIYKWRMRRPNSAT